MSETDKTVFTWKNWNSWKFIPNITKENEIFSRTFILTVEVIAVIMTMQHFTTSVNVNWSTQQQQQQNQQE